MVSLRRLRLDFRELVLSSIFVHTRRSAFFVLVWILVGVIGICIHFAWAISLLMQYLKVEATMPCGK